MTDLGIVRSTVKPNEIEIDEYSVWINTNIKTVDTMTDGEAVSNEYEYNQIRYAKDEYIRLLSLQNQTLQSQLLDTQLALCEIYEGGM